MNAKLPRDLRLFLDDDAGFVGWCYENPDGFFVNCLRRAGEIVPCMLHSATRDGKLCQHFRNSSCAGRIQPHLTDHKYCKVCSRSRAALEKWAADRIETLMYCSSCVSLP